MNKNALVEVLRRARESGIKKEDSTIWGCSSAAMKTETDESIYNANFNLKRNA